jgi:hypothetical protein
MTIAILAALNLADELFRVSEAAAAGNPSVWMEKTEELSKSPRGKSFEASRMSSR